MQESKPNSTEINFSAATRATEAALWTSIDAVEELSALQEQIKIKPASIRKTVLGFLIAVYIAGHKKLIRRFDKLQESIGRFQLEPDD
jgi:hypothetical protein